MSLGRWVIQRNGRLISEVPISATEASVGSDTTCHIVLSGPGMPGLAATFEFQETGMIRARIYGFARETVREEELDFGDILRLGEYTLSRVPEAIRKVSDGTRPIEDASADSSPLRLALPDGPVEVDPRTPVTVGRDDDNDIVIRSDVVSGHHCRLETDAVGWRVVDLGSTNGTFVDGVRIDTARLIGAGHLALGDLNVPFGPAPSPPPHNYHGLIFASDAMGRVLDMIEKVARLDEPVLIRGETGTGKELIARALHHASPRSGRSFLARNCGGIPESIADGELFGSVKGGFSDATDKAGVFEGAAGGTVFLDELGEMPLSVQPKLLRALQEKKITRLGALQEKAVDFRLVAATHRDLEAMVMSGTFREDLYHRVSVFELFLPPLRARPEDIVVLSEHLLGEPVPLSSAALDALRAYSWPGNVRELRNVLMRANTFRSGPTVGVADLSLGDGTLRPSRGLSTRARRDRRMVSLEDEAVRAETARVWEEVGRSTTRAAQRLGIAKSTMHRRKGVYGLPDPEP